MHLFTLSRESLSWPRITRITNFGCRIIGYLSYAFVLQSEFFSKRYPHIFYKAPFYYTVVYTSHNNIFPFNPHSPKLLVDMCYFILQVHYGDSFINKKLNDDQRIYFFTIVSDFTFRSQFYTWTCDVNHCYYKFSSLW